MQRISLDSSVVVTFLLQEPNRKSIQRILEREDTDLALCGPALTEVIAVTRRKGNRASGSAIAAALPAYDVAFEHADDNDLLRAAELLEQSEANPGTNDYSGKPATLSLGDSLIIGVSEGNGRDIITRDAYWRSMAELGLTAAKIVLMP